MTHAKTQTREAQWKASEGPSAPVKENAQAFGSNVGTSTLSLDQPSSSVNAAVEASFGQPGVQIVPVAGSVALERAHVHNVFVDGQRIGGVCYVRGAWRVLAFTQARFASREAAVNELLRRREGSS